MRIAYYLNDGTKKIGDAAEFQRDYDANAVDAKRRAAVEIKTDADLETFAQASVLTGRLEIERKAAARDAAFDFIRRAAPKAAIATLVALFLADQAKKSLYPDGLGEAATALYRDGTTALSVCCCFGAPLVWAIAKSAFYQRRSERACKFRAAVKKARTAALEKWKNQAVATR